MPSLPPLVVLGGATATGKTGLSLRLAEATPGTEIISADSRQVYRGMDIGTAKVGAADRARIRHYGLDLVDPDEPFSVADFVADAATALHEIAERGGTALLVGGTGLYLRAVARGLDVEALPSDPEIRATVEADLAGHGLDAAVERLRAVAPRLADRTDLRNPRRVGRALEIALIQGDRPLPPPRGYPGPVTWIGLHAVPAIHRAWIENRAIGQFEGGLVEEAGELRRRYPPDLRSFSAIGYPEAFAVLGGRLDVPAAIEATFARTIAFAKRQRTWFRAEPGIAWLDASTADPFPAALDIVQRFLENQQVSLIS